MQLSSIRNLPTPQPPAAPPRLPSLQPATPPREHPVSYQQRQGWWKWQRFYLTTSIPDPPLSPLFLLTLPPLMPVPFGRTAIIPTADPHTPPHYLPA
jgi:hypothetical protein